MKTAYYSSNNDILSCLVLLKLEFVKICCSHLVYTHTFIFLNHSPKVHITIEFYANVVYVCMYFKKYFTNNLAQRKTSGGKVTRF